MKYNNNDDRRPIQLLVHTVISKIGVVIYCGVRTMAACVVLYLLCGGW